MLLYSADKIYYTIMVIQLWFLLLKMAENDVKMRPREPNNCELSLCIIFFLYFFRLGNIDYAFQVYKKKIQI
jgi:hypothetical protein